MYENSESVGQAWTSTGLKREELVLTTKLSGSDPRAGLEAELKLLQTKYVDLWLIHTPKSVKQIGYGKAWSLMEDVLKEGKTRSIGVSNYMIDEMTEMLETAKVIPAVNQIEFHPYCYPYLESLVRLCHERGITIECYGPLSPITKGKGGPLDPVLQKIAGQTGLNEGQVLLKWAKQVSRGVIVTTSTKADRLKEHLAALQAPELTSEQVDEITQAGRTSPQRFFKGVLLQPEQKPAEKKSPSSKSKGLPLGSTLMLVALFLLLLPLAMASPAMLFGRDGLGYADPADNGGKLLTIAQNTWPEGLGEPLNAIISTNSDPRVLFDSADNGGFLNYMLAQNLGEECFGQALGTPQEANLGDGQGNKNEVQVLRWNYGDIYIGTCMETFKGGLHARYWYQNTTGAIFLAVSEEKGLDYNHDIIYNGYNLGRDWFVGNATNQDSLIPTVLETVNGTWYSGVTNQTTYSGDKTFNNYTYHTDVQYVSGLLPNSSDGVNHADKMSVPGMPAVDGLVAVLTVSITATPQDFANAAVKLGMPALGLLMTAVAIILTL